MLRTEYLCLLAILAGIVICWGTAEELFGVIPFCQEPATPLGALLVLTGIGVLDPGTKQTGLDRLRHCFLSFRQGGQQL